VKKRVIVAVVLAALLAASACAQTTDLFKLLHTGTPRDVQAAINRGADVNARNEDYQTPLIFAAAHNNNPEMIAILLRAGAAIEAREPVHGATALHWAAAFNNNPNVTSALLRAGARINSISTRESRTALMWAVSDNFSDVAMVLLRAGADAKIKDNEGQTALDYAHRFGTLKGTDALKQLEEASK
jgi:ankyrin repeat protein